MGERNHLLVPDAGLPDKPGTSLGAGTGLRTKPDTPPFPKSWNSTQSFGLTAAVFSLDEDEWPPGPSPSRQSRLAVFPAAALL